MSKAMKFLKSYKGKKANMKIEKKLASMSEAEKLVKEAHTTFNNKNTVILNSNRVSNNAKQTAPATRVVRG
jgi:hypothetical protein